MKYPKIVKTVEVVGKFQAVISFDDGERKLVDFSKLPLDGVFAKAGTDLNFFKTIHVKAGYVMWKGDHAIDSDFLYENGEPVSKGLPETASLKGGFIKRTQDKLS